MKKVLYCKLGNDCSYLICDIIKLLKKIEFSFLYFVVS